MRILIGVDDSRWSQAAIDWVKRIPRPAGTHVTVLSAVRPVVVAYSTADFPGTGAMVSPDWIEDQHKFHEEVAARCEKQIRDHGVQVSSRVMIGDPREALLTAAIQERADLIVVGSHGRTGLPKLIMGSVASHVVTHAPCSVVVARPADRP